MVLGSFLEFVQEKRGSAWTDSLQRNVEGILDEDDLGWWEWVCSNGEDVLQELYCQSDTSRLVNTNRWSEGRWEEGHFPEVELDNRRYVYMMNRALGMTLEELEACPWLLEVSVTNNDAVLPL